VWCFLSVNHFQVKDVQVATIKAGDAALLRTHVVRERVIVMALVMGDSMMDMMDAREILSVGATTASSLVVSIMRRMIAAKNLQILQL